MREFFRGTASLDVVVPCMNKTPTESDLDNAEAYVKNAMHYMDLEFDPSDIWAEEDGDDYRIVVHVPFEMDGSSDVDSDDIDWKDGAGDDFCDVMEKHNVPFIKASLTLPAIGSLQWY